MSRRDLGIYEKKEAAVALLAGEHGFLTFRVQCLCVVMGGADS